MQFEPASAFRKGEIVGQVFLVVDEVVSNQVSAISETKNELLVTEVSVVPHQVPDQRADSDIDQWFGNRVRVLPQASPKAAAKQDNLHVNLSGIYKQRTYSHVAGVYGAEPRRSPDGVRRGKPAGD